MTMVNQTADTSTSNNYNSSQVERKDGNNLDKNAFFELLTTQLKYQDPLSPMDNTQFIAQMAQFSSLEQMENMNANMGQFLRIQGLSEASSLIGKTVETIDPETGEVIKGVVEKVTFENGNMYAHIEAETDDETDDGTDDETDDLIKINIEGITAVY